MPSLFFGSSNNSNFGAGTQVLWTTAGPAAGVRFVDPISLLGESAFDLPMLDVNGTLFFSGSTGTSNGRQLWATNGTAAGTTMLTSIAALTPDYLTNVAGTLMFVGWASNGDVSVWKSNGTAAGTTEVFDMGVNGSIAGHGRGGTSGTSNPEVLAIGSTLFFTGNDGVHGYQLWSSNGASAGTVMASNVSGGMGLGWPAWLTNFNGTLYFEGNDSTNGAQLWKSDGTAAGTQRVTSIGHVQNIGPGPLTPTGLTVSNGVLFFAGKDVSNSEPALWKSDGTAANTTVVYEWSPNPYGFLPVDMTDVNGTLFFFAEASSTGGGYQLWKSDGTTTARVKVINPSGDAFLANLGDGADGRPINFNGELFFAATDGVHGFQLWKSDGSPGGTVMVKQINLSGDADPGTFAIMNGRLYFTALDGSGSSGLWMTDGTEAGTVKVASNVNARGPIAVSAITLLNAPPPGGTTADMILRGASASPAVAGQYEIYDIGSNSLLAAYYLGQVGTDWQFVGLRPFYGSDTSDMLLRSASTGGFEVYDIANNNITGAAFLGTVGTDWQVMGFGNFSSRGESDMILRNVNTGGVEVYDIANNQLTGAAFMGTVGLNWQFSGVGNFSGRGTSDMLLRNANTGGLEVYDISNNAITNAAFIGTVGLNWQFSGVGNFSGVPGETDLLLRNANTGGLEVYDINNNQLTGAAFIGTVGLDWQYAGIAPIHAASASDLVLRNVNTGAFEVYDIANNQLVGAASLGQVGLDWSLGGFAADPPTGSMASAGDSSQASQLVQAMAGFGGGGGTESLNTAALGGDPTQQSLLTTPQHA
jgi:ELWxxDGT repeat protein